MKYYKVTCRRGHVGRGRVAYITFYISAESVGNAMTIAQNMGGVHHSKPPVLCKEVTKEEYIAQRRMKRNAYVACGAK